MKHLLPAILFYMNLYHEVKSVYILLLESYFLNKKKKLKCIYFQEGYKLLGCLSLLFTIIHTSKARFDGLELEVVLQEAYKILLSYKEKEKTKPSEAEDSNFSTSSINM